MRQDGQSATVIPPTRDIDDALRTQLLAFGHGTTINAPIAGCPRWAALVVVAFNPNDGAVRVSVLPPGPKPMPTSLSIEDYQRADAIVHPVPVFVGPTPLFGGTPCPGETERRGMIVPRTIAISPESARFFRANNAVSQIRFVLTLRLDGQAALSLPRQLVIDDALRAALVSATQKIALRPPIEGCARPAGAFIGMVSVPDGTFDLRQVPPKP